MNNTKAFNIANYQTNDPNNPKDLSILFIRCAYELLDCIKKDPFNCLGLQRYVSHGYYLKIVKSNNNKKQFNLTLCKRGQDPIKTSKSNTYREDHLDIAIPRLLTKYLELLHKDNVL